jgi:dimethylaniline monooxygenase (N-oxide forming)
VHLAELQAEAEKEAFEKFPLLKNPPPSRPREVDYTPFRLHCHMLLSSLVEKNDRSLIFTGLVASVHTTIYAEVAALWGISWMEDMLDMNKTKENIDYDIARVNF